MKAFHLEISSGEQWDHARAFLYRPAPLLNTDSSGLGHMPESGNLILPLISSCFLLSHPETCMGRKWEGGGWSEGLCTMLAFKVLFCLGVGSCDNQFGKWGICMSAFRAGLLCDLGGLSDLI